jgi:HAD superfamily hydrolase (TIGR01450 family)
VSGGWRGDPVDTVACDIDGVVLLGKEPVPGARAALETIRDAGISVVFVTNNSTRTREDVAVHVERCTGFRANPEMVVTSGVATSRFLAGKVDTVYVLGSDGLRTTLRAAGIAVTRDWREAEAVVAGLDFELDYEVLAGATLAVNHGAGFYATNTDATYPMPEGAYPGAGALVAAVTAATGVAPVVCGKPHGPMQEMVAAIGEHPMVVGDRPETDIALGDAQGWPTALVLTGVVTDPGQVPAEYRPDVVLDSIAELPGLLGL